MKINVKTGKVVNVLNVVDNEDIILITEKGVVMRQHIAKISVTGRNTQGVHLIKLAGNDNSAMWQDCHRRRRGRIIRVCPAGFMIHR